MTTGFQTFYAIDQPIAALPGSFGPNTKIRSLKNSAAETRQVSTVQIGTIQANSNYTITLTPPDGTPAISVTVNSGSLTAAQTRDAIVAALRASRIFSYMVPAPVSTANYTLTGRKPGVAYTLAISATHTSYTLATVAATTATVVPFGRIVARKTSYAADVLSLPTATDDVLLGVSVIDPSSVRAGYGSAAVVHYGRNEMVSFTDNGDVYIEAETDIAINSTLHFRHAVDGSLDKLGVLSASAGTGKTAIPAALGIRVLSPSLTLPSGQTVVYCRVLRG